MSPSEFKAEFDHWKNEISERDLKIKTEMGRLIDKTKEKIQDKMLSAKRESLVKMVMRFCPHMMKHLREKEDLTIMARQEAFVIANVIFSMNGKKDEFISLAKEFKIETDIEDMMSELDEILKEFNGMRFVAIVDNYDTCWGQNPLPYIPTGEIELWEKE